MAALENNNLTVGPWPLPGTAKRSDVLGNLFTAGSLFAYELRPIPYDNLTEALANGDISSIDDYVAPYSTFTLNAKAIPTEPDEIILSCSFKPPIYAEALGIPAGIPFPAIRPFKAILEEPNPTSPPNRTEALEPLDIKEGPTWTAPPSEEPYLVALNSGDTATLIGYYTEKAWYDRSWVLRYPNCLARVNADGIKAIKPDDVPKGVPLDMTIFDDPTVKSTDIPSFWTPERWYPKTKADAEMFDAPEMLPLLQTCSGIISYKATEIKKLRFFYVVFIERVLPGRTLSDLIWYPCFMTVQYNSRYAEQRLQYALSLPKTPTELQFPPQS